MGRRRSGRRRRSSSGDVGGSQPKSPANTQPDSPATTSLATSPQTACADSAFEEAENSVPECSGAQAPNSGSREDVVQAEWVKAHPSENAADSQSSPDPALTSVADSDMDEEPVVRMTESAESKRRSIKVSHSEKFYAKKVVVTSDPTDEDRHARLKSTTDSKWQRSDERARCPEDRVDGTNVKASHQKGRIADKISLFERGPTKAVSSSTNMRHLDISPARNVAVRLTEHGRTRPISALPNRTVKERAMNFNAGGEKLASSSAHALNEGQSKTAGHAEASCSGEPEVKPKPTDQTDSKSHNATQSKPALSESTSDSNIGNRELFCSVPTVSSPSDETPQVKSPNRTSSQSKKRRIKDTAQPLSPTSKNKQDMDQGKQEVKSNTAPNIPTTPLLDAGDVVNTTDQCLKSTSGEEVASKTPKAVSSNTDSKRLQKTPQMDTKGLKEMKRKERANRNDFEGSASQALNSQTENSSNEVNIERTGIGKNSDKQQPVQEGEQGEGRENRDTIVNTLFGESGKLDPSVTKDEKPPSPEDLKAANSKDSLAPANTSAASSKKKRKDSMRNRESETDMLVLPEKDTITCVHTAKNDPKSERPSKPNYKSKEKEDQSKKKYNVTEATETLKHSNEVNTIEGEITTKATKQGESKDTSDVKLNDGRPEETVYDQTKENDASTSGALATPNSLPKQNDLMDAIISPQIPLTEGGGPKRGGPSPQSQSESREEQKERRTTSSKREQQEQKTQDKTKSKITSTENTSIVNGDLNSVGKEDQSVCPEQSGEKILSSSRKNTQMPPSNEKKKPSSLPPTANEASTSQSGQDSEKITATPASTNETVSTVLASTNEKATPLPASTNEKATPLPASTNEKATPLPASTNEKAMSLPASANEKATPPTASANGKDTPLPASVNEKATPLPPSANEKATPLPASTNEKATSLPASANEKATPLPASANEKATPLPASANEKATPLPPSANDKATPLPASANEKTTPLPASANEKATPLPASTNEKATPLPPSANEKATPLPASANEKATPLSQSTNEKATPLPASDNEKTTPPPASTNETTSTLPASTNKKTTPAKPSTKEHAPPPATTDSPVSIDKTTKNERALPLPAASSFPLTSTNGENITPLPTSNDKTVLPPASIKENTMPPHASTKEKISHTLPSASEKAPSPSSKSTDPATRKKEFTPKPFFLPQIPSAPGSSSQNRDSPSSWLDVDHQRPLRKKQLISELKPKLSTSGSKTNRDTLGEFDPDDFIANVKRLAMPFNLPRRKHNQHRLQVPPPVLPAIREDRFEKPFDPEEFQHGLRKRREFILDLPPSSISKSPDTEDKKEDTKPKWTKPERESILTRSLIFQRSRKESKQEEEEKEEKMSDESTTEPLKTRSRLERCSIVSILRSSSKGRRVEFLSPTECPSDGLFSPADAPGSTPPPQSQLAPAAESPEQVMVEEVQAKSDGHFTPYGTQVILKHSKDVGPTMTPAPKTTSRDQTVTMVKDTKAPPSDTQSASQVVLKPTKEDGPVQAADLKTNSSDPQLTNSPPTPSGTQSSGTQSSGTQSSGTQSSGTQSSGTQSSGTQSSGTQSSGTQSSSQVLLKHTKNDGPTMTPDLKATSRDPKVTMLTDTNALLHPSGTQTTSQDVLKPTKDDGPTPTTSADTKAPPLSSSIQTGSDVVLQPDGPILMPDLKTTPVDPIATIITAPPPLPSFEDIKLPSLLEKFLQKKPETSQSSNKIDPPVARESAAIPGLVDLNTAVDVADRKTQEVTIPPAASQILPANPQRELPNIPAARGIHRRPAKIVIFELHQFNGQSFEFYRDQPDATQMQLSTVISVKVVRGCWILYEKPGFEGRCIALEEEGVTELPNQWAEEGEESSTPLVIGSIRLAVRDYTPPRIELFTEPTGRGRSSEYVDVTEEVGSFGLPHNTGSIKVHSGLWLVYSDPGFQGLLAVMEAGEYPFPEDWGFPAPMVGSLRPLRMGLPKVENPTSVKAVLYERAGLEGRCVEVQGDVFSFETDPDDHGLTCVESLKILGGLWVGFEREGFDGQQFLLEEGEYLDWRDWGGTGKKLLSLRPVLMDFSSPHMKMFSELDFSKRGVSIDLLEPLENVSDTHFGPHTGSIEVLAGVWVVFEEPGLSGRQYVLEKGLYGSPEDWGASDGRISSAVPVTLDNPEHSCHFQIQLFSEPGLDGTSVVLQDSLPTMPEGFSMRSCRVYAGSWLAFSSECFSGHQCVLEEGVYPDLRTMGFTQPNTSVLSIQPTGHEFSRPSVVLFERSGLKGRRTLLKSSSVNLQLTDSCTRVSSILVEGGMWVLYEASNFRGSQFLLKPGAVPDWPKLSSWQRIGSLRPLIQKQTLFRLRNEEAGLMMSVTGSLEDIKLMRIQVSEERGGANQIWAYHDGRLQCKWLPDCCVDVGSGVLMPGTRAVLSSEPGKPQQLWNISSDGIIRSNAAPHLVLEVKGGQQFDKSQIILNEFQPNKMNQRWSLEIL